ncbi:hypothetical protein BH23ACT5_BH23ACT5_20100 [soil metagenome]
MAAGLIVRTIPEIGRGHDPPYSIRAAHIKRPENVSWVGRHDRVERQEATTLIEDIRVLEVLNNPMRLQILHQLKEPRTVRELSEVLAVPVTRLYHHVNLLERADVIGVVKLANPVPVCSVSIGRRQPGSSQDPGLLENIADKHRIAEAFTVFTIIVFPVAALSSWLAAWQFGVGLEAGHADPQCGHRWDRRKRRRLIGHSRGGGRLGWAVLGWAVVARVVTRRG